METPTASTSSPYQYQALNESASEIRLLHLLPGPLSSPIRVVLEPIPFSPDTPPVFEALSYTWGSPEDPIDIFVGASGCYTLAVTQNLAEALPYLRYEDRARTLWIDAICVHQGDMAERTSQIKRMADIYSKARGVVVWLGPASEDSSIAIDVFETICSNTTVNWETYSFQPRGTDAVWVGDATPVPLDQAQTNSILNFLSRAWFERLWIWQEVKLPTGDITVMCGYRTICWSAMCHAILYLLKRPSHAQHDQLERKVNSVIQLCSRRSSRYCTFSDLLTDTQYSKCTDPRDRIFALLSLQDPREGDTGIDADYSKTISEIYKNAALCILRINQTLGILTTAGIENDNFGLPSWVPKWPRKSVDLPLDYSVLCSGNAKLTNLGREEDEGIIQVPGVSVATVDRVEGFRLPEYSLTGRTDIAQEIRRIASWLNLEAPGEESDGDTLAFCRSICADNFAEGQYPVMGDQLSVGECLQALRCILRAQETTNDWGRQFIRLVGRFVCGRAFFVTADGRLGLGPKRVKPGDIVACLLAGATAFILRPADANQHQLVGEAYCQGFMDAEALLGPLPGNFRLIRKLEMKTKDYWWGHMDSDTEQFYCEDPRLGELPSGWKKKSHSSDEYWNWFVNEESGGEMKDDGDPRLTPEALKARGVDLKVFKLV